MDRVSSSRTRTDSEFDRSESLEHRNSMPASITTLPTNNDILPDEMGFGHPSSSHREFDAISNLADPRVEAPRILKEYDVASLIINKMIGTGIFTGPFTVLAYTRSKQLTIGMWILGFLYTILSMIMYLEYARKLPFTGGELVYLDDLLPKKRLWAYTLYAFYFVFVYTTCTNAMQFGTQVLLAYSGTPSTAVEHLDKNLVRFLAVAVTTAVCILLYISDQKSRLVNRTTAGAKVMFLIVVFIFGCIYVKQNGAKTDDWGPQDKSQRQFPGFKESSQWVPAFITVLFSFHGWENATLVAGEIPSFYVLRKGFIGAVGVVGMLYLLIVFIFCLAFDWDHKLAEGQYEPLSKFTAAFFSPGKSQISDTAAVVTATLIAISAVGSMLSVAYTGVRVKQSIGWTGIFPWSWFWRRAGPLRPRFGWQRLNDREHRVALILDQDALTHPGSPEGGILMHWIVTVVYICITATRSKLKDAIDFSGNLLVYGHFFIEGFVAIGFIWFDPHHANFLQFGFPAPHWLDINDRAPPFWMRQLNDKGIGPLQRIIKGRGQPILGVFVLAFSVAVVGVDMARTEGQICMGIIGGILGLAWIYWALFVRAPSASSVYKWLGYELHAGVHGQDDGNDPSRRCHWCDSLPDLSGHRHPHDSYKSFNEVVLRGVGSGEFPLRTRVVHAIFGERSLEDLSIHPWYEFKRVLSRRSRERTSESTSLQDTR